MSRRLGIFGASGHGKVVAEVAMAAGWADVLFFDDAWPEKTEVGSWPVVGNYDLLVSSLSQLDGVLVAIGDNSIRYAKQMQLLAAGAFFPSIVHPRAVVSRSARLGAGTVVVAGAIVNADSTIGAGVILNTNCSVDHDCVLEDAVHVSPGAHLAGGVHVGKYTWLGIGAIVRQGISIGSRVMVGAGAVVVNDISNELCVIGVPARVRGSGWDR